MKRNLIFIGILFFIVSNLFAQSETLQYSGEIGSLPITMNLTYTFVKKYKCKEYTEYSGYYYYNKYKKSISISGSFNPCGVGGGDPNKAIFLSETSEGLNTGAFELYCVTCDKMTGFWESPDGKKKLKVTLTKVK